MLDPRLRDIPPELFEEPEPANHENEPAGAEAEPEEEGGEKQKPSSDDAEKISRNQDGIAIAFAERYKNRLKYCHHAGRWYHWSGNRWAKEETKLAFHWARELCRAFNKKRPDSTIASVATAAGVERFAQADRVFAVTSEIWDRDPFLLCTPGGTVDLTTGKLRPAQQTDYMTKQTAVTPAAGAHPVWSKFLEEATFGDVGLQRFLQQVAGYSLTGDTREHALFFIYGPGGNGKSVFLNVITGIVGDYVEAAAMDTFTASKGDRHPTDIAKLKGARLVSASETEEGRAWAESRIKELTGGDKISARFMRQDFFEFRPQFKLVIVGNHKPVLRNVDDAAKRRFNIIPFTHKPAAPDRQLEAKLKTEWPAILQWAIEGCLDWQRNGLVRPAVVADATAEYFSEQDLISTWIAERCDVGGTMHYDTTENLFASWSNFATAAGEQAGTAKAFSDALVSLGYEKKRFKEGPNRNKRGFKRIAVRVKDTSSWQRDD